MNVNFANPAFTPHYLRNTKTRNNALWGYLEVYDADNSAAPHIYLRFYGKSCSVSVAVVNATTRSDFDKKQRKDYELTDLTLEEQRDLVSKLAGVVGEDHGHNFSFRLWGKGITIAKTVDAPPSDLENAVKAAAVTPSREWAGDW